ncbi:MAG TPA: bifunctional serine/threonine-protein kinase/formylglycine-generating enzyme family protein [Gemmatales bacterium]|nr:bifunctional serine/threonine-protein kinase/formylglycine-generating enzyme family protein [Gemmatales bacterium]
MPDHDPKLTTDFPAHLPELQQDKTTSLTRHITVTDPDNTRGYVSQSYGSTTTADVQTDSAFPSIPGYEIAGILGRGGMGVVYRAKQTALHRLVAIKMILGGKYTDPVAQARFLIEAEVIAAIQHPNIVQVHEFGRHDDQPFFVLEFVCGGSLSEKLKADGRFSPRKAASIVAKLADGMAAAHQKGVIHRDLKPANVLLTEVGEPKVTDFGLAKTDQSDMTVTGAIVGTPSYMSPEQAAGKTREVGTPTDVYALGVILYELLTGRPPFKGDTMIETIQLVLNREPERPRGIEKKISLDLETICLKCLEKDAKKRYATMAELATELRAFLDGRPIMARPVGLLERAWKWTKRNPAWTAWIAAGLLLGAIATITGIAIRAATQATGLVHRVLDADTAQVPAIVGDMAGYRKWVDPLLRDENRKAAENSRQKLHTSLALLPVDDTQVDYLYGKLLDATPQEVSVIRDALVPHKAVLLDKLWSVVELPEIGTEKQRLRAAAALARYDPENDEWSKAGDLVVNYLVLENPVYLERWSEVFRPVKNRFLTQLSRIYQDHQPERTAERSLATSILADYAADQPQVLADLLMDADEKQFAIIYPKFQERGEQGLPLLTGEIDKKLPAELPSSDNKREKLAKRQANAAVVLLRMNQPAKVWPLLEHSHDPRVRSNLIHKLSPLGANVKTIVNQLDVTQDISIRRALLLCLGEFGEKEFTPANRLAILPKVREMYRTEADPGLHAACEWLLRTWKQEAWLKQVNDEWAKGKEQRERRWVGIENALAKDNEKTPPQWYVNGQGQTMVVIPGPVEFVIGSPTTEVGRSDNEFMHKKRIGWSFVISAKSVTVEQYRRFAKAYPLLAVYARTEDLPIVGTSWYQAVAYCNWLSKEEGIPEDQWCYEIQGDVTKFKEKYLSLSGYRLPTEAEMEYATRAGAFTSRYYGETEELLGKYAWYQKNSQEKTWPVGSLKPNDFGLFDVQGNVFSWCQDSYTTSPPKEDKEETLIIKGTDRRMLRGGTFFNVPSVIRSAFRGSVVPSYRSDGSSFRPARTLPLSPFPALQPAKN